MSFMMYAQRFFRPIQDLSEKFNILQTAMAASERIFKLLDEPVTIFSPAKTHSLSEPRGEIEFRNVWFAYHGGARPERRRLGAARRFLPRRTRPDARDRRPHRRGQDHDHPASAALLRHPARPDPARRRGHSRNRSAGSAPHVRHRAAGPVPVHRHARIKRQAGTPKRSTARPPSARCGKSGSGRSSSRCHRAWKRQSPSAARRFLSASGSWSVSRARWRTIRNS